MQIHLDLAAFASNSIEGRQMSFDINRKVRNWTLFVIVLQASVLLMFFDNTFLQGLGVFRWLIAMALAGSMVFSISRLIAVIRVIRESKERY